jgi:uncharacterized protein (TIGR02246 family)
MFMKAGTVFGAVAALCCGILAQAPKPQPARPQPDKAPPVSPVPAAAGGQQPPTAGPAKPGDAAEPSDDEKAIQAAADAFTRIYNAHDAKGLAALFASNAEMIDEDGVVVKGREAIEASFVEGFEANPMSSMEVDVESVRTLTSSLGIEEGTARSKDGPDDEEVVTTYVAIHVKTDGKWLLACVRDWAVPPSKATPHDHLQDLAWMVGEWVEEGPDSVIRSSVTWHDNGNFLIQEFSVQVGGEVAMSGTMRIGWDAVKKQFKSWVFDSHGGHVEGYWLFDGDQWIVKSQGATAEGEAASSTTIYVPVDSDTVVWSSIHRLIDGEPDDDIGPIIIKRRPPRPMEERP